MASLRHCQQGDLNAGPLSPLRELFLEIQVNKLINDYLLPTTAEDIPPSSSPLNGNAYTFEFKENIASYVLSHAAQHATSNACNAPCESSSWPFRELHGHTSQESLYAETDIGASNGSQLRESHSPHLHEWNINLKNSEVNEQMVAQGAQSMKQSNVVHDATSVTLSVQNEQCKISCLSRADTFPCTSRAELQMGWPLNADTDTKLCAKKPPRPPKLPDSNKVDPNLTRCHSEVGTLLQSSRRAKLEKKRQSSSTSFFALLFTLCFAVIMIGQGFLSQGSQEFATFGTNASSAGEEYMKSSSRLVGAQGDVGIGSKKNLLLNVEGGVTAEHLSRLVKQLDVGM